MSHHGDEPFAPQRPSFEPGEGFREFRKEPIGKQDEPEQIARNKLLRATLETTGFRGAVGIHPDGVLRDGDEGLIRFAVGHEDGKVVIDFGKPVAWLGMTPQQAADFASSILNRAREAGRKQGETVAFRIGA